MSSFEDGKCFAATFMVIRIPVASTSPTITTYAMYVMLLQRINRSCITIAEPFVWPYCRRYYDIKERRLAPPLKPRAFPFPSFRTPRRGQMAPGGVFPVQEKSNAHSLAKGLVKSEDT